MTIVMNVVWSAINAIWQSAALALFAWLALRFIGRVPAAARYSVWTAVLVAVAILPIVNLLTPAHPLVSATTAPAKVTTAQSTIALTAALAAAHPRAPIATHNTAFVQQPGTMSPLRPQKNVAHQPAVWTVVPRVQAVQTASSRGTFVVPAWAASSMAAAADWEKRFALPMAVIWFVLSAVLLVRLGVGLSVLARIKRGLRHVESASIAESIAGASRRVAVGSSADIDTPCVIGYVRPVIAVPASLMGELDSENLGRVLSHEMAHVRRYDDWANLAQRAAQAIFWINPVVHFACRRLDIDREIACDDMVAAAHRDRVAYARCLADIARKTSFASHLAPAAGFFPDRRQIVVRIEQLLDRNHHGSARIGVLPGATVLAVLLAVLALSRLQVPALAQTTASASAPSPACTCPHAAAAPHARPIAPAPAAPKAAPGLRARTRAAAPRAMPVPGTILVRVVVPAPGNIIELQKLALDSRRRTLVMVNQHDLNLVSLREMKIARSKIVATRLAEPIKLEALPAPAAAALNAEQSAQTLALAPEGHAARSTDDFLDALQAAGYTHLTVDQLIEIRNSGVNTDYLRALKNYGVTPIPVDQLVALANAGVSAQYLAGISKLGYARLSVNDLITLANSGVSPEYIQSLSALGYHSLRFADLVQLANNGVRPEYVAGMEKLGYGKLGIGDIIKLADAGVSVEYVQSLAGAGYSGLSTDDLIRLANAGVTAGMIKSMQTHGIGTNGHLSVDDLIKLANAGL
jgi:beta-lactamase regulating signal transducer with metallopeptidase domain